MFRHCSRCRTEIIRLPGAYWTRPNGELDEIAILVCFWRKTGEQERFQTVIFNGSCKLFSAKLVSPITKDCTIKEKKAWIASTTEKDGSTGMSGC